MDVDHRIMKLRGARNWSSAVRYEEHHMECIYEIYTLGMFVKESEVHLSDCERSDITKSNPPNIKTKQTQHCAPYANIRISAVRLGIRFSVCLFYVFILFFLFLKSKRSDQHRLHLHKHRETSRSNRVWEMSVIDLITRVDAICKKYDKYDIDKQKDLNDVSGDDAFARLYGVVEADLEAALQVPSLSLIFLGLRAVFIFNLVVMRRRCRIEYVSGNFLKQEH